MRIARDHPWLTVVALGYVGGLSVAAFITERPGAIVYAVVMVAAMLLVARVHARVTLSGPVLWGLAVWGLVHMLGGLMPVGDGVLYSVQLVPVVLRFDQAVHAFGFGVATVASWQALRVALDPDRAMTGGLAILVFLMGMGIGAFNEVFEFAATRVSPDTNVGGYENTGWDLVANMTGAILATLWVVRQERRRRPRV